MNKLITITALLLLLALVALVVLPVRSDTSDNIIVGGADTMRQASLASSGGLSGLLSSVTPRLVVSYANTLRQNALTTPPGSLLAALNAVKARIIIAYANTKRNENLSYPQDMIQDNTPPLISGVSLSPGGLVTWTTDEFATSVVHYGTQPGAYPFTVSDPLFVKLHQVQLPAQQPGVEIYLKVSSTDRDGNTFTSGEFTQTQQSLLFLPAVYGLSN
jgi:hypothetical protein